MIDTKTFDDDMVAIDDDWNDSIVIDGKTIKCLLDSKELSRTQDPEGYGSKVTDKNTAHLRTVLLAGLTLVAEVTKVTVYPNGTKEGTEYRVNGINKSPDGVVTHLDLVDPRN